MLEWGGVGVVSVAVERQGRRSTRVSWTLVTSSTVRTSTSACTSSTTLHRESAATRASRHTTTRQYRLLTGLSLVHTAATPAPRAAPRRALRHRIRRCVAPCVAVPRRIVGIPRRQHRHRHGHPREDPRRHVRHARFPEVIPVAS